MHFVRASLKKVCVAEPQSAFRRAQGLCAEHLENPCVNLPNSILISKMTKPTAKKVLHFIPRLFVVVSRLRLNRTIRSEVSVIEKVLAKSKLLL